MAYSKQTWKDDPDHTTPLSANRLNHMEDGIADAATSTEVETAVTGLQNSKQNKLTWDGNYLIL